LEAEIELFEASLWYETEREGLGYEFDSEVNQTLERIASGPKHFPILARDIRRALVDRFPYGVFFVEFDDEIAVIGIIHLHRDPQTWKSR
jgi:hypothetical protein